MLQLRDRELRAFAARLGDLDLGLGDGRLADVLEIPAAQRERWTALRDEIAEWIWSNCYDAERGTFRQAPDLKAQDATHWTGGTVLDPAKGKTYKSKVELQAGGNKLNMDGCIAFICRTQTWVRE